jgi:hypothetical protein
MAFKLQKLCRVEYCEKMEMNIDLVRIWNEGIVTY